MVEWLMIRLIIVSAENDYFKTDDKKKIITKIFDEAGKPYLKN